MNNACPSVPPTNPVGDGPHLVRARSLCSRYSPYDLASKIGAFYTFNISPVLYPPLHLSIRYALLNGDRSSNRVADPRTVFRILEALRKGKANLVPGMDEFRILCSRKTPSVENLNNPALRVELMRMGSSLILGSGTMGQRVCFALKRFGPFETDINNSLGFNLASALRAQLLILVWINETLLSKSPVTTKMIAHTQNAADGPIANNAPMMIPPMDFIEAYNQAITVDPLVLADRFQGSDADFCVIEKMTTDIPRFCDEQLFMTKWYGVRLGKGKYQLPLPDDTLDTFVTALSRHLSESFGRRDVGSYARRSGKEFEKAVFELVRNGYPEATVKLGVKFKDSKGDTVGDVDVLAEMADRRVLLVQCKARRFRPSGRFGSRKHILSDFRRNVVEAFRQAHRILNTQPQIAQRVLATIVVNEEYIPSSDRYLRSIIPENPFIAELPNPIVMGYCDLEYLMARVPFEYLRSYVEWREKWISRDVLEVSDESDTVFAFHEFRYLFWREMEKKTKVTIQFDDREFEEEMKYKALELLRLPSTLLL
jgi:hypothetical protein